MIRRVKNCILSVSSCMYDLIVAGWFSTSKIPLLATCVECPETIVGESNYPKCISLKAWELFGLNPTGQLP